MTNQDVNNVFSQQTQLEWENPLDLSILVNGGKENNNDSLSSREWNGRSPPLNPLTLAVNGKCEV